MYHEFRPLELPEKTAPMRGSGYRVYVSATEFVMVDAKSAGEAIEKSGIEQPVKVELAGVLSKHFVDLEESQKPAANTEAKEADSVPEAAEIPPEPEANAEQPASE